MSTNSSEYIIVLSALDIWSMGTRKGAQSLYKTLIGIAKNHRLYFITSNKNSASGNLHNNIAIVRFGFPFLEKSFKLTGLLRFLKFFTFPIWWLLFQLRSFYLIRKILRKEKTNPALLYAYEIMGVPVSKFVSRTKHIPLVTRFQGTILYPLLSKPFWQIKQFHHYLALKTSSDVLIMTDDGTKGDQVLARLHNSSKKICFWLNGVDRPAIPSFSELEQLKKSLGIPASAKILLTISRLAAWKRVDRAIIALSGLKRPDVHLIIVGEGDEMQNLVKKVRELNLEQQVHFAGAIDHKLLGCYYSIADIFLSLYDLSNVGNPLLEAMSLGKAIITLNNGDTQKYIKHLENGILIEPQQDFKIVEMINSLFANPQLKQKISENAKKFAAENFWTWDERIQKESQVIDDLIRH